MHCRCLSYARRFLRRSFYKGTAGLPEFLETKRFFLRKTGLEIGGPSRIFRAAEILPVYALADRIDGCNFSTSTVWEGEIKEGMHYLAAKRPGYQYIAEAGNLKMIPSETYDFVLASHCLEHVANPLGALKEWLRVLRGNGSILLVLPDKNGTFDHRRPTTSFSHLMRDFEMKTAEDDLTHLDEILSLHDLSLDPKAGDHQSFAKRSSANFQNRCLHHHVFDLALIRQIYDYFNLRTVLAVTAPPYHMITLGLKEQTRA